MIDATKLEHLADFYIKVGNVWKKSYWIDSGAFICVGDSSFLPDDVTDAISIPSPEKLEANAKELAELRSDHAHALAETKRRVPDYPFTQNTMSECVWALGESLIGTERAIEDWQELAKQVREVISDVANSGIEHTNAGKYHVMQIDIDTYNKARTLLEKMT